MATQSATGLRGLMQRCSPLQGSSSRSVMCWARQARRFAYRPSQAAPPGSLRGHEALRRRAVSRHTRRARRAVSRHTNISSYTPADKSHTDGGGFAGRRMRLQAPLPTELVHPGRSRRQSAPFAVHHVLRGALRRQRRKSRPRWRRGGRRAADERGRDARRTEADGHGDRLARPRRERLATASSGRRGRRRRCAKMSAGVCRTKCLCVGRARGART